MGRYPLVLLNLSTSLTSPSRVVLAEWRPSEIDAAEDLSGEQLDLVV
jgi:hypothetical protein